MKKVIYFTVIGLVAIFVFSCKKQNETLPKNLSFKNASSGGFNISVTFKAGHDGPGQYCYFPYLGDLVISNPINPGTVIYKHIPCVGKGEKCTWKIGITFGILGDSIILDSLYSGTITLSSNRDEPYLTMPARSFLIDENFTTGTAIGVNSNDDGYWINLPAQNWTRIDSLHYELNKGLKVDTIPEFINAP